ncbi:hypothetical protein HDE69_005200 [Pedobacter cryoconitis]|uniref:Uncharacterized protein n=1 Tax=Pedobacter cryoconitis TaxID=188932 RepID=A0A7W8YYY8_9SPHI|nr:hypothetical protein [Pedobacter cryoconitis]MBB5624103.1 hypothetical protein [Pedobacter cryoconitis]
MDINITLIEAYCKKNGRDVTTSISIENPEPYLNFIAGKDAQGSLRIFLSFSDLKEILVVNNMINDGGLVLKERDASQESLRLRPNDEQDKDKNIERLIYNTLSRYVIQMLNAASGQILFPEIVPLPNHKSTFFKDQFVKTQFKYS